MKAVLENEMESTIPLDRGFNKNIKWMTFANAEVESRARLFILTTPWTWIIMTNTVLTYT